MTPTPRQPLLPLSLPPCEDEALSSWLLRLAAAHGLRARSLYTLLHGREAGFKADLNGPAGEPILRLLAARTGLDPDVVRARHTLSGFQAALFPCAKRRTAKPWVLPQSRTYGPWPAMQFCPLCLGDGEPYFRRMWRLSLSAVCSRHGAALCHVCPACAAAVDPIKGDIRHERGATPLCWKCGFDLRRAQAPPADAPDQALARNHQQALQSGLAPPAGPAPANACGYFAVLALLCSRLLDRQPRLVRWRELASAGAGVRLPIPAPRRLSTNFDTLADPALRRPVLRTGSWLLEDWPSRFLDVAASAGTRTSDFLEDFSTAPAWLLDPLRARLTPARHQAPAPPGLARVERMRALLLAHRHNWVPSEHPRLLRLVRESGFYSPNIENAHILKMIRHTIDRLRAAGAGARNPANQPVGRDGPEWSRLLGLAEPYRKGRCHCVETLRRGIRLLCAGRFLTSRDLGELLGRSGYALTKFHLKPLAREGALRTNFALNRGGLRHYPGQAYRSSDTRSQAAISRHAV